MTSEKCNRNTTISYSVWSVYLGLLYNCYLLVLESDYFKALKSPHRLERSNLCYKFIESGWVSTASWAEMLCSTLWIRYEDGLWEEITLEVVWGRCHDWLLHQPNNCATQSWNVQFFPMMNCSGVKVFLTLMGPLIGLLLSNSQNIIKEHGNIAGTSSERHLCKKVGNTWHMDTTQREKQKVHHIGNL